jgi:hypothetical protein
MELDLDSLTRSVLVSFIKLLCNRLPSQYTAS